MPDDIVVLLMCFAPNGHPVNDQGWRVTIPLAAGQPATVELITRHAPALPAETVAALVAFVANAEAVPHA